MQNTKSLNKTSHILLTSMSDVKTVNISGGAEKDIPGSGNTKPKRGGRRSTKKSGGGDESLRGVSANMNVVKGVEESSLAQRSASPDTRTWLSYPSGAPVPPAVVPHASVQTSNPNLSSAPTLQYTQQVGGVKHVKVELKKKGVSKKVHLNPKKIEPKVQKSTHTRKIRKITLGLKNLHKRMTRAKKLHNDVKEMPIDKLKDKLVKGGLIKANSKAPESVLRQIARDSAVLRKKAL
jgi:hypothetical protein